MKRVTAVLSFLLAAAFFTTAPAPAQRGMRTPPDSTVAVPTAGGETLLLVAPARGEIVQSISVPANVHGAAAVEDEVFVGDRKRKGMYYLELSGKAGKPEPRFIPLDGPAHHLASFGNSVFATVTRKGFVAVVNAETGQLESKFSVPTPYYSLVIPERNRLYVTSKSTGSVHVIDLDTREVARTIPVGKAPSHLAYDGDRLWVTNAGSGDVSVVDAAANREVKRIPSGADPHGVAYDSGTGFVFVANRGDRTLSVIEAGRMERSETREVEGVPGHLTSMDGRILVALRDPGAIEVLNPASLNVERTLKIGMQPHQMVVLP